MMDSYYDSISEGYDSLYGEEQRRKARLVLESIELDSHSKILDVGGGTGAATDFFPGEKTVLDPSEKLLIKAKGEKVLGVAERLPFEDNSFELVISLSAIHHFDDAQLAIKEMLRVSKKYVAISLIKKSRNYSRLDFTIRKSLGQCKIIDDLHDTIFLKMI